MNRPRRVAAVILAAWGTFWVPKFSRASDLGTAAVIHGGGAVADCVSTRAALNRGAVEVGPLASHSGPNAACILRGAAWVTADVVIAKKAPKLKWPFRVVSVATTVWLVNHNGKVRK